MQRCNQFWVDPTAKNIFIHYLDRSAPSSPLRSAVASPQELSVPSVRAIYILRGCSGVSMKPRLPCITE
eukprot:COSAG06_NODE_6409_length_2929_cov_1.848559_4_plen_69_part_00